MRTTKKERGCKAWEGWRQKGQWWDKSRNTGGNDNEDEWKGQWWAQVGTQGAMRMTMKGRGNGGDTGGNNDNDNDKKRKRGHGGDKGGNDDDDEGKGQWWGTRCCSVGTQGAMTTTMKGRGNRGAQV